MGQRFFGKTGAFMCAAVLGVAFAGPIPDSYYLEIGIPAALAQTARQANAASPAVKPVETAVATAPTSPCLQKLQEKKLVDEAKPKKKKGGLLGAIGGTIIGAVVGTQLCDGKTGADRLGCIAKFGAAGGAAGFALGKLVEKSEERKIAEASYKAALTQRPVSIALKNGCAIAEPKGEPTYEPREVQLSLLEAVTPPSTTLRSIGGFQQSTGVVGLNPSAADTRKSLSTLQPGSPAFVMGSVDKGKWVLVGKQDPEKGYVASGWARGVGWTEASAPAAEPTISAGSYKSASVKVEVPCSQSTVTIRNEATNKQESPSVKSCIMPDGVPEIA